MRTLGVVQFLKVKALKALSTIEDKFENASLGLQKYPGVG